MAWTRAACAGARTVVRASRCDPWGNLWWVQEHVEEVDVSEMIRRMSDPAIAEVVTAYEGSLDAEMRRRSRTD